MVKSIGKDDKFHLRAMAVPDLVRIDRKQEKVIEYLRAGNQVPSEKLGKRLMWAKSIFHS